MANMLDPDSPLVPAEVRDGLQNEQDIEKLRRMAHGWADTAAIENHNAKHWRDRANQLINIRKTGHTIFGEGTTITPLPLSFRDQAALAAVFGFTVNTDNVKTIAIWAFDLADAMEAERKKRG